MRQQDDWQVGTCEQWMVDLAAVEGSLPAGWWFYGAVVGQRIGSTARERREGGGKERDGESMAAPLLIKTSTGPSAAAAAASSALTSARTVTSVRTQMMRSAAPGMSFAICAFS